MPNLVILRGPIGAGKTSIMHRVRDELPEFCAVELDALKRMLDPQMSSSWRRNAALAGGIAMSADLLESDRSVITETHSRWPEQAERLERVASEIGDVSVHRFLVTAPFETCLKRAVQREIPGISYAIDATMVREYYANLEPEPGETVIDTSTMTLAKATDIVMQQVQGAEACAAS